MQREATPLDRRGTQAVLTVAGRAALKAAWPVYAEGIREHFTRFLQEDEAQVLTTLLERIATAPVLVMK